MCKYFWIHTLFTLFSLYITFNALYIAEFLSGERSSTHCKMHHLLNVYVAVLGRNQTLFRYVFRSHCCIRSALAVELLLSGGSCMLCKLINTFHIYTAHMSPALNKRSVLQRFELSNACNGIMFSFYPGLPHMRSLVMHNM